MCWWWVSCFSGAAADLLTLKTNYYIVTGSTRHEVLRSLALSRPWRAQSQRDARTEWRLPYEYRAEPLPGGCRLSQTTVRTTVTITLPRWRYTRPPPPNLVQSWQRYLTGLLRHEKGHEELAIEAGQELKRRLDALGVLDCARLRSTVEQTRQNLEQEFRRREAAYDRDTDHGRTQGARWGQGDDRN